MATVRPTTRAKEQIAALPFDVRESVDLAFANLATDPREAGHPLGGTRKGDWAMRVLEYRIIYRIRPPSDVIVYSVLHRPDAYPPTRH